MNDSEILAQVRALVDQEHELRAQVQSGAIDAQQEQSALKKLEEELDQCWDLLRQRRARHDAGQAETDAAARPVNEVESYLQ